MNRALEIAELLERILKHGQPNTTVSELWAIELGVQSGTPNFIHAIACIEQKFSFLNDEIESLDLGDRAKKLFINSLVNLRQFVSIWSINAMQRTHLESQQNHIDMMFLAAENLSDFLVPDVNPNTLMKIESDIQDLTESVRNSDVDAGFRSMLLTSLSTLLMAIHAYSSLGPDGAAKVYGAAAAEIARLGVNSTDGNSTQHSLIKKAMKICKQTGAAIIFAGAVIGGAHKAIEDGSSIFGISDASDQQDSAPDGD